MPWFEQDDYSPSLEPPFCVMQSIAAGRLLWRSAPRLARRMVGFLVSFAGRVRHLLRRSPRASASVARQVSAWLIVLSYSSFSSSRRLASASSVWLRRAASRAELRQVSLSCRAVVSLAWSAALSQLLSRYSHPYQYPPQKRAAAVRTPISQVQGFQRGIMRIAPHQARIRQRSNLRSSRHSPS